MKTAELYVNELNHNWNVGTFSRFCDEPADFEPASDEELKAFVKQIQLDAYRAGGLDAAEIADANQSTKDASEVWTHHAILTHFNNPKLEIPK